MTTNSENITALKEDLKDYGATLEAERIEGSHYNLKIRKTKSSKESSYYFDRIEENATKDECNEVLVRAIADMGLEKAE